MKKIMIALAVATVAIFAEAATVNWASGTLRGAASAEGGKGTTAIKNCIATDTTLDMMVYLIDSTTYSSLSGKSQQELYDAYFTKTASGSASVAAGVQNSATVSTTATVGTDYYAVVIATYTDKTYGDMYIATTATIAGTSITNPSNAYDVGTILTASSGAANNWQAVPEPTSGLLLLLGVAGLALKRKKA